MQRKEKTLEAIRPHLNTGEELVRLMEKLFFIIKISVEETNPEQRYLTEKLAQMNFLLMARDLTVQCNLILPIRQMNNF